MGKSKNRNNRLSRESAHLWNSGEDDRTLAHFSPTDTDIGNTTLSPTSGGLVNRFQNSVTVSKVSSFSPRNRASESESNFGDDEFGSVEDNESSTEESTDEQGHKLRGVPVNKNRQNKFHLFQNPIGIRSTLVGGIEEESENQTSKSSNVTVIKSNDNKPRQQPSNTKVRSVSEYEPNQVGALNQSNKKRFKNTQESADSNNDADDENPATNLHLLTKTSIANSKISKSSDFATKGKGYNGGKNKGHQSMVVHYKFEGRTLPKIKNSSEKKIQQGDNSNPFSVLAIENE